MSLLNPFYLFIIIFDFESQIQRETICLNFVSFTFFLYILSTPKLDMSVWSRCRSQVTACISSFEDKVSKKFCEGDIYAFLTLLKISHMANFWSFVTFPSRLTMSDICCKWFHFCPSIMSSSRHFDDVQRWCVAQYLQSCSSIINATQLHPSRLQFSNKKRLMSQKFDSVSYNGFLVNQII